MVQTKVQWIGDEHFVGIDSSNHSVVLSAAKDGIGVRPSDMLLVALSACTSVDVVSIMEKKRQPLSSLEVIASGEKNETPPWAFRKIHLLFRVRGKKVTPEAIGRAIQLSQEKYCSVGATVRGVAEITTSFEILPEEGDDSAGGHGPVKVL